MHAFILAGGFATRLWPLTESRAKPLLPLAGKTLLSHIVEKIPDDIAITVSTNAAFEESFREWTKNQTRKDIEIRIEPTLSDDKKLGTNGAVAEWIIKESVQDDVLLITGDNYLGFSMKDFLSHARKDVALLAAFDIHSLDAAKRFGTVIVEDNKRTVTGFEEKPAHPKSTLVSTGCYLIPASYLSAVVEYAHRKPDNIGGIFEEFLHRKLPVDCFTFHELWFDVGSFEAYLDATKALVGNELQSHGSVDEESSKRREGSVVIGKDTTVRQSALKDTVVFERCMIEDCVLERCVIDNDCHLKGVDLTGKMIRAGTVLKTRS